MAKRRQPRAEESGIDKLIFNRRAEEALAAYRENPHELFALSQLAIEREISQNGALMAYRARIRDEAEEALQAFAEAPPPVEEMAAKAHAAIRAFYSLTDWILAHAPHNDRDDGIDFEGDDPISD